MSRTGWLPVTAIAVLATVIIGVLATLGHSWKSESAAFFQRALHLQVTEFSTIHATGTGTVTMLNGDVYRRHSESVFTPNGDRIGRQWYEGCNYPYAMDTRMCSIENVIHNNVRYQKVDTSDGAGEWETKDEQWDFLRNAGEPNDSAPSISIVEVAGDVVEVERETVDGVTYRRYRVTRRPGEETLRLIDSGEWDPQEWKPPEGFPESFTVEDYIDALRVMMETQLFTDVYWVHEDSGEIWRVERQSEKTYEDAPNLPGALLPRHSIDVVEYSKHSVPVEIRPPIE